MRLIDADKLLKGKEDHQMISTHLIWNAPTIDAVQVIRCKDCAKFKGAYGKEYRDGDGYGYCSGEGPVNGTPCDGYCNEAVRKGEEWMN